MVYGSIPIKTPEEIAKIKHAATILKEVLDELEKAIKPGMTTLEIDEMAESLIVKHEGCTPGFKGYQGFPRSICISRNEEVVHGVPRDDQVVKEGDIIGLDLGVFYEGFHTDSCRTVMVGEVEPEVVHFVKTTKKAMDKGIKQVKPGAHVGDISESIQKTLEQQGYAPVIECTGHGVGRNLHEPPEIMNVGQKGTGPKLEAGMVLAIEPIATMGGGGILTMPDGWTLVSDDGTLSAHFEHTVLVTENGHEVLT